MVPTTKSCIILYTLACKSTKENRCALANNADLYLLTDDCFDANHLVEADTARAAVQAWVDGAKVQSRAGDDLGVVNDWADDLVDDRAHNLLVNDRAVDVLNTVDVVVVHVLLLDLQVHDWLMVMVVVMVNRLRSLVGESLSGVVN